MSDDGFAFIVPTLQAELPDAVGTFFQVRSLAGMDPFWILEYGHGRLTLMVAVSAEAPLPDVRYGEHGVGGMGEKSDMSGLSEMSEMSDIGGAWWLCGPAHFRSHRMQLIHASNVSPTRAAIVALVERCLAGSL